MVVAYQNITGSYIYQVNSSLHPMHFVTIAYDSKLIGNEYVEDIQDARFFNYLVFGFSIPVSWVGNTTQVFFVTNEDALSINGGNLLVHTKVIKRNSPDFNNTATNCSPRVLTGSFRLDIKIFGLFVATEAWLLGVLIIALVLYINKSQPAYSRSIAPFLTVISYIFGTHTIWFLDQYMDYEWYVQWGCIIETLFNGPLYAIVYLIGLLNYVRYVLINNLNWSKQKYYSQEDGNVKLKWYIRILNWLTTGFGLGAMVFIIIGLLWAFHVIQLILLGFSCKRMRENDSMIFFAHAIVVLILTFLVQILDYFLNWRKIIVCKLRDFFWKSDPFLFRLERSSILVFVLLSIPSFILDGTSQIGFSIIATLLFHWLLWTQSYFVIGATIIQSLVGWCRSRTPQKKSVGFFNEMFRDEELLKLFIDHASNEWNVENPLIKRDILKFKDLKNESERKEFAGMIVSKYLSGGESVMELNISYQQREPCVSRFKNEGYCGFDLFDNIEGVVTQNLFDIWNRFRFSKEYKDHLLSMKAKNLMIENK